MPKKLEFRTSRISFHTKLMNTVREIGKCKSSIVSSDKTINSYEIPISDYNKLLKYNITEDYEKCNHQILNHSNYYLILNILLLTSKYMTKKNIFFYKRINDGER